MKIKIIVFSGLFLFSFALNSFAGDCPKILSTDWSFGYLAGYMQITEPGLGAFICESEDVNKDECLLGYYEAMENKSTAIRCVGVEHFLKEDVKYKNED